jgi:uncharacterized repeat protein (TIGR02543 family)
LTIADKGGYSSAVGEYTIKLGIDPTAPYTTNPANFPTIKAKVIEQDLINTVPDTDSTDGTKISPDDGNDENKDDPTDPNRYTIAATKVIQLKASEVAPLVGYSDSAKVNLIGVASAKAYQINGSTGIGDYDVDIPAGGNPLTAGAAVGSSFYVTFIPEGVPSVWIKVKFIVSADAPRTFTVTFNANGGTLVGPSRVSVTEPSTTLPYMPASPIRAGYTFRHWSTSSANNGAQFVYDTRLTGDITLYALWDAIPPVVIPEQPPINVVVNPPSGGGTTIVTAPPTTVINNIPETPTPTTPAPTPIAPIVDPDPPLEPPADLTWSLLDLLATILAALLLIVFFIKFFFDRPRDEVYEEEPIDAQLWAAMTPEQRAQYQARRESDYQVWLSDQQRAAGRPKTFFVNAPVLLIVGAGLVEALIVLFMTQDFSGRMIIVDDISVVFAAVLFIQCLAPMVAAAIRNNRLADQRFSQTSPHAGAGAPTV